MSVVTCRARIVAPHRRSLHRMVCERCHRTGLEVSHSDQLGAHVCRRCYLRFAPPLDLPEPSPAPGRRSPRRSDWQAFRFDVLDALDRIDRSRLVYIDRNTIAHVCPACRSDLPECLSVRFIGVTQRCELACSAGCTDAEVAAALGLEARP